MTFPTYRGATANNTGTGAGTSLSVSLSATGAQAGDLAIFFANINGAITNKPTFSGVTGWRAWNEIANTGNTVQSDIYTKKLTAADITANAVTITFTSAFAAVGLVVWQNAKVASRATMTQATTGTSVSVPSVTPPLDDTVWVGFISGRGTVAASARSCSVTPNAAWTERVDNWAHPTATNPYHGVWIGDRQISGGKSVATAAAAQTVSGSIINANFGLVLTDDSVHTLMEENLDGYSDGHVVAVGDSGSTDTYPVGTIQGSPTIDTTHTPYGTVDDTAVAVSTLGATTNSFLTYVLGGQIHTGRIRIHFRTPAAWASASLNCFVQFSDNSGGRRVGLTLAGSGAPGQLRLMTVNNIGDSTPNNTMALNTEYYADFGMDLQYDNTGVFFCKLYRTSDDALLDTLSGTAVNSNNQFSRISMGLTSSSVDTSMYVSHLKLTDDYNTTDIGPWGTSAPPTGPKVRKWNGSAEIDQDVASWNGTAEVPMSIDRVA